MTDTITSPIKDRAELIYLLNEAAEFEHTVMCGYLYALWTLKQSTDEGVTEEELKAMEGWRKQIRTVALEEMLHLCLVNNLLTAFGAAPHLGRPNFPVPAGRFPADILLRLTAFDESTIQHFMFIERPLEVEMADGDQFRHLEDYHRELQTDLLSPSPTDYSSQGQFYYSIANGIDSLAAELGEDTLFAGHGDSQVDGAQFSLPGLFSVTDLESAHRAIEEIVLQGEGAPAHREDSHYARFKIVHDEFMELKKRRPAFVPGRPAATNPRLNDPLKRESCTLVRHPLAIRVADLGNAIYILMLRTFVQVFSPTPLPAQMTAELAQVATSLMYALTTAGEATTRLPLKEGSEVNAGLSFEMPRSISPLLQRSAAQILGERAAELTLAARELATEVNLPGVVDTLDSVANNLDRIHKEFEEKLSIALSSDEELEVEDEKKQEGASLSDPESINQAETDEIRLAVDLQRCIHSRHCVLGAPQVFLANVEGPWLHPEASTPEHIRHIAHNCPSGAVTYEALDSGGNESAPEVNVARIWENGPYAVHADIELEGHGRMFRTTLCRCGKSKNKPFCDGTHKAVGFAAQGEHATKPSELLKNRGGKIRILPTQNGPLQVNGNLEICSGTGQTLQRIQTARLCRCGGSAQKPFCDNTHTRNGFRSDD